ncbi:MAG: response regulator [Candidatus Xenobiia bacterium LiM19]
MKLSETQKEMISRSIVLIVDDTPENLEILGIILSEAGFKVSVATNGTQAIAVAKTKPPDLILMDVMMPGIDGFEACKKLKDDPLTAHIPVIFLTARAGGSEIVRGFEAGGLDYVIRPFNTSELLARVMTHIELKKSRERIIVQNHELMEMNERLSASEENQRLLNAMKDKFFSILAHDLMNPLNTFLQITDLIAIRHPKIDEEKKKELMMALHNGATNLCDLLQNILTWARSHTGHVIYKPCVQAVAPTVKKAAALFSPAANQKSITVRLELPDNCTAFFDEPMISTVLRNLISNAIKFTRPGGSVTVSVRDSGDFTQISVSDTGVGITQSDLSKLFRMDIWYSTRGTDDEKGTGIGLILCREFVEKHGGTIWAESEHEKGSTFSFTIPGNPF